jgi:hypothetical protein
LSSNRQSEKRLRVSNIWGQRSDYSFVQMLEKINEIILYVLKIM